MTEPRLVTIVVPAYNVEEFLAGCLDSLLEQTVKNHRIIVVDDGSTDSSGKIADKYAAEYPEDITVIHQQNAGLSAARNAGLEITETPYISFLDSDDWQDRRFVEKLQELVDKMEEAPDLIYTMPWIYDCARHRVDEWYDRNLFNDIFEVRNGKTSLVTNARQKPEMYGLEVNACRKVYRTGFLKMDSYKFPVGLAWEDIPGHFHLLHNACRVAALPDVGFFYRTNRPGQITAKRGKQRLDMLDIFNMTLDISEKEYFADTEKVHIISLIIRYTLWNLESTDTEYIGRLLDGLKKLYGRITDEEYEYFLYWISPEPDRDSWLINTILGDDYMILADNLVRERELVDDVIREENHAQDAVGSTEENQPEQLSRMQSLLRCIADHGISYTVLWFFRKYVFRTKRACPDKE